MKNWSDIHTIIIGKDFKPLSIHAFCILPLVELLLNGGSLHFLISYVYRIIHVTNNSMDFKKLFCKPLVNYIMPPLHKTPYCASNLLACVCIRSMNYKFVLFCEIHSLKRGYHFTQILLIRFYKWLPSVL